MPSLVEKLENIQHRIANVQTAILLSIGNIKPEKPFCQATHDRLHRLAMFSLGGVSIEIDHMISEIEEINSLQKEIMEDEK